MKIPLVDLVSAQAEIAEELWPALQAVVNQAAFIGGEVVAGFERAYANFVGVEHCIGVANGTDAIELALRVADVGPGHEVILPANSFIATAEAVSRCGATPVLVDVDPVHLLIDPVLVERAVTSRTRAIIPVHLFGQVAPVEQLLELSSSIGIPMIEDAAQSQGASRLGRAAGTWGLLGATSFYPGKNLGAAGDAGAVLTDDTDLADRVRTIAAHGSKVKYMHEVIGCNSRLDAIQAVVLSAKLKRLAGWNEARRTVAHRYAELLADQPKVQVPLTAHGNTDVWHLYVVQVDERDRVLHELNSAGIGAGVHYPHPIHLTPAYAGLGLGVGTYPVAEAAATRILSLPLHPHLTADQQQCVVTALRSAVEGP